MLGRKERERGREGEREIQNALFLMSIPHSPTLSTPSLPLSRSPALFFSANHSLSVTACFGSIQISQ
jgi:hypothetical protein